MSGVVSFRPQPREEAIIRETMRTHGFRTRTETIRFLIRQAGTRDFRDTPLGRFRLPGLLREGEELTSEGIDKELYGEDAWPDGS